MTVAQYLKGAKTGSYDVDVGTVLADLVEPMLKRRPMSSSDETIETISAEVFNSCQALVDDRNLQAIELFVLSSWLRCFACFEKTTQQ